MMFKTIIFGGFLFATVCATTQTDDKPKMASLEVLSNFDQSLAHREFRVHYSGAGKAFSDKSVSIKIYKKDEKNHLIELNVKKTEVNVPKAYYFGHTDAADGEYEVEVCADTQCSGRNPSLTKMESKVKGAVTCFKVNEDKPEEKEEIKLDLIGPSSWITDSEIQQIESRIPTEWKKHGIQSNPSFKNKLLYASVLFDIAYYRDLFLTKEALGGESDSATKYAHEFCERKYFLSSHVHLLKNNEVKYRFKKTLYLSEGGKQALIIKNVAPVATRPKIHVEMAFENVTLEEGNYQVWISLCATEKDENDSTVCSEPFVHSSDLEVSGSD